MKKFLAMMLTMSVLMVSSIFVAPIASATDVCSNEPRSGADFYVESIKVNWLLSMSCVDSEILTTMPAGSVMHVIGKTEGWHKLETEDGLVGWMWEDYVAPTTKAFNPKSAEPEPAPAPDPISELEVHAPMFDIAGHKYEDAIWYVYNNDIVQGYEDHSYQPDKSINRAELVKIIVEAAYTDEFEAFSTMNCFSDVFSDAWYSKYVCFALSEGIVEGYSDGSFRPANEINFVEALKIVMIGLDYMYVEGDPWYRNLVEGAADTNFIPLDINAFNEKLTRGQMADMITRILKFKADDFEEYFTELSYFVTYDTIEAGLNVEDYVNTGDCIYGGEVYENGTSFDYDECTTFQCGQGQWYPSYDNCTQ